MAREIIFFLSFVLVSSNLNSAGFLKDFNEYREEEQSSDISNDLVYGGGTTQVTSQINEYDTITANKPIHGSIFVTHDARNVIDENSFSLGDQPLKVVFVQTTPMSVASNLVVTIYSFELKGLPIGSHTLPSINVKVAGKKVQALPLTITVTHP